MGVSAISRAMGRMKRQLLLGGFFAIDAQKYKAPKWGGEKTEPPNKEPHALACFVSSAKQKNTLYCLLYGWEHEEDRKGPLKQLKGFRERKPELFTIPFLVSCWNRLRFVFTESVRGGPRTLIRIPPTGDNKDSLVMLALLPHMRTQKRMRRWQNLFSSKSKSGMRRGRIPPELEEKFESDRILGSDPRRHDNFPTGAPSLPGEKKRPLEPRAQTGSTARVAQSGVMDPLTNCPLKLRPPVNHDQSYPQGNRLRSTEFDDSEAHAPRDGPSGKPLCWNFNANCGCPYRGKECENGIHKLMKKNGSRWATQSQMARRGGAKGAKLMSSSEIDGYIHSLRETESQAQASKADAPHAGGYGGESLDIQFVRNVPTPPGLDSFIIDDPVPITSVDQSPSSECTPCDHSPDVTNPWVGKYPPEIDSMDLTLPEANFRPIFYGRDDWFAPIQFTSTPIQAAPIEIGEKTKIGESAEPYLEDIYDGLRASLLNWLYLRGVTEEEGDFAVLLAAGLRNILPHGNSRMRQLSSSSLDRSKCLDRFRAR